MRSFCILAALAAACRGGLAGFTSPPDETSNDPGPVYVVGDFVDVNWSQSYDNSDLTLWGANSWLTIAPMTNSTNFHWSVGKYSLSGTTFTLILMNNLNKSQIFRTHEFTIQNHATTSSSPAERSSTLGGGAATSSSPAKQSNSLGGGAIAGIVVGAVAGIALVAAGVFLLRRRRAGIAGPGAGTLDTNMANPAEMPDQYSPRSELESTRVLSELDSKTLACEMDPNPAYPGTNTNKTMSELDGTSTAPFHTSPLAMSEVEGHPNTYSPGSLVKGP